MEPHQASALAPDPETRDHIQPDDARPGGAGPLRLDVLFARSPIGKAVIDAGGVIQIANAAFARMTACAPDDLIGAPLASLAHPEELPACLAAFTSAAVADPPAPVRVRLLARDGRVVWADVVSSPMDETGGLSLAEAVDVTAQVTAEAAVRASEARLAAVLDAIPALTYIKAADGTLLFANHQFSTAFGEPPESAIGRRDASYLAGDADQIRANDLRTLAADGPLTFEETVTHVDGTRHTYLSTKLALRQEGQPVTLLGISVDLTDRIRTARELARAVAQLEAMLEHLPVGLAVFDRDLRFVRVNAALAAMNGHAQDEHIGRRLSDILPSAALRLEPRLRRVFETGVGEYGVEISGPRPGARGEVGHALASWYPIRIDGRVELVGAAVLDITARKVAEERVAALNTRFALAEEAAHAFSWEWELVTGRVERSANLAAVLGYRPEELTSTWDAWAALYHPDDLRLSEAAARSLLETSAVDSYVVERRLRHKDGAYRWLSEHIRLWRDEAGRVVRVVGQTQDVTERKAIADELARRRQEFETLVTNSPHVVALFDRDLCVRYVNPAVRGLLGVAPEAFVGRTFAELDIPAEMIAGLTGAATRAFASGEEQRMAFALPTPTGTRHVHTRFIPEPGPGGEIESVISITYDETDRVLAEADRQIVLDAVAHDLKNPLAALRAHAQLMHRQVERRGVPDQADLLQRLGRFIALSERMTELIDELGDQARLAMDQPVELDLDRTDLVALVRQTVDELLPLPTPHRLTVTATEQALYARVDPRRLRRVVANLIGNAAKYSPAGGEIDVRVGQAGDAATIAVRDEGIGIPAAEHDRIFEFRARASNVSTIRGSGIGLASARRIVEQHGGRITVESDVGAGSTFTVHLPLEPSARS